MDMSNWDPLVTNREIVTEKLQQLADDASRNELEDGFHKLQKTNLEIIQELIDVMALVRNHQQNTRVVKTTGTSIGALGAVSMVAGVCLAPVTAGASTLLSIGGFVATATSCGTAIGADIFNRKKNQTFFERIEKLQGKQNEASIELKQKLGLINQMVEELTRDGISEEDAIRVTFSALRYRMKEFFIGSNGELSVERFTEATGKLLRNLDQLRALGSTVAGLGAGAATLKDLASQTVKSVSSFTTKVGRLTASELQSFRQVLQSVGQGTASTTTKVVLKGFGAVTGVIFSAVDIAFLIKEWKTPHPLIEHIESVVYVLLTDVDQCYHMVDIIRRLESSPENSY